jgi:hypothetical protein
MKNGDRHQVKEANPSETMMTLSCLSSQVGSAGWVMDDHRVPKKDLEVIHLR